MLWLLVMPDHLTFYRHYVQHHLEWRQFSLPVFASGMVDK